MLELQKEFKFEASHILPKHPGRCSRLHGHSWKLRVSVMGNINPETGFVMDYADLKKVIEPIVESLDHRHLGQWGNMGHFHGSVITLIKGWEVVGMPLEFYPSSENLIVWIANQIGDKLDSYLVNRSGGWVPKASPVPQGELPKAEHYWSRLELDETCTSRCILTREAYDAGSRR